MFTCLLPILSPIFLPEDFTLLSPLPTFVYPHFTLFYPHAPHLFHNTPCLPTVTGHYCRSRPAGSEMSDSELRDTV